MTSHETLSQDELTKTYQDPEASWPRISLARSMRVGWLEHGMDSIGCCSKGRCGCSVRRAEWCIGSTNEVSPATGFSVGPNHCRDDCDITAKRWRGRRGADIGL